MGFTVERSGFIRQIPTTEGRNDVAHETRCLALNLWKDMLANGFTLVDADGFDDILNASTKVVFAPTAAVDPLIATNPWRVYMEVYGSGRDERFRDPVSGQSTTKTYPNTGIRIAFGTPEQIKSVTEISAGLTYYPIVPNQLEFMPSGVGASSFTQVENPRIFDNSLMSYRLTIVPRGFVVAVWMQSFPEDLRRMGVVCVQRGVGCGGTVSTTGQTPLFLVTNVSPINTSRDGGAISGDNIYSAGPANQWFYQVIRESDTIVANPVFTRYRDINGNNVNIAENGNMALFTNTLSDSQERGGQSLNYLPTRWYTPVTSDTGEYIMVFPFGLTTSRFAYSDEIDLIAISKADAYQSGQTVPLTVYNDSREYTAYNSNNQSVNYDSGIRVFIMTNGGGIA